MQYDAVITNGRWFDGTGGPSALRDIGVQRFGEFLRAGSSARKLAYTG